MTCLWQLALQSFWVAINSVNHSDKPQAQIWPGVVATFMHCSVLPSMKSLLSQLLGVLGVTTLSALPLRGLPQVQRATRPKGSVPDDFLRWFISSAWCRNIQFQPFEPSWGPLWRAILALKLLVGQLKLLLGPCHSSASSSACSFLLPLLSPGVDLKSTAEEVSCLHALRVSFPESPAYSTPGLARFTHTLCHDLQSPPETIKPKTQKWPPRITAPWIASQLIPHHVLVLLRGMAREACLLTQAYKWTQKNDLSSWYLLINVLTTVHCLSSELFIPQGSEIDDHRMHTTLVLSFDLLSPRRIFQQTTSLCDYTSEAENQSLREYKQWGTSSIL